MLPNTFLSSLSYVLIRYIWICCIVVSECDSYDVNSLKFIKTCFVAQDMVSFCECSICAQKNVYSVSITSGFQMEFSWQAALEAYESLF